MSSANAEWIAKNIDDINISFDGPRDIQDFQRPTRRDTGSFKTVCNSLDILKKNKKRFHFRGTITDYSQDRMPEIVEFFSKFNPIGIQLEPMFISTRSIKTDIKNPDDQAFVNGFIEAEKM